MRVSSLLGIVFLGCIFTTPSVYSAYLIDINSGGSPTASGFVGLDGSNGSSVTDQGVTFTVYGSEGTRDRGTANDLTRDFAFNDSTEQVGLEITGLAAGLYQASVYSFEGSGADINVEFIGYETNSGTFSNNPGITPAQATDPARVFTFTYDPSTEGDLRIFTQGIVGFQCVGCPRARFNALELTAIPVPAALPLFGTGLAGLGLIGWRRRNK